jgi:hypothetical protein
VSAVERRASVLAEVVTRVPDDVRVLLPYPARDRDFRVERIEERIDDGAYRVCLWGPLQTLVGKDHTTHSGYRDVGPDEMPPELAELVIGEAGLRQMLREAGEGR